jgi:hypothetical protein
MPLDPPIDGLDPSIDLVKPDSVGSGADTGSNSDSNPTEENPVDELDTQIPEPSSSLTSDGDIANPEVGDTLTAPAICEGGRVTFYRIDPSAPGGRVIVAQATSTYTMVINDVDYSVYAETECPEPSSPTGYGEPISTTPTPTISSGCNGIDGITYNGTVPPPGNTVGAQITLANGNITCAAYLPSPNTCAAATGTPTSNGASSVTLQNVKGVELVSVPGTCGGTKQLLWRVTYATGTVQDRNIIQIGDNRGFASLSASVTSTWNGPGGVTYCP